MGRKRILLIFENSLALEEQKFKEVPEILEKITDSEKFEINAYSFSDFTDCDAVKFWKAVIICPDATNFSEKVEKITSKFDPEYAGKYTILLESDAKPETTLPVIHTSSYMADLASWWPHLLWFLFPRQQPEVRNTCLFLFDIQTDSKDHDWYKMVSSVLTTFDLKCLWIGDLTDEAVPIDLEVILCQNGGSQMLETGEIHLLRNVKTIVFTDDKNSSGYKLLKKKLRKKYGIQSDTPTELDYLGWSILLRELKLIICKDVAFAEKRKNKKRFLCGVIIAIIIVLIPFIGFLCFCDLNIVECFNCCCCVIKDNEHCDTCNIILENVADPCHRNRKVTPKKLKK